jgi:ABC-type amino acid transport substrate-binding protein
MRKVSPSSIVIAVIISAAITFFAVRGNKPQEQTANETAYSRVIRTGVLRCAYGIWEPGVMRDPNTGEMSGIVYDFMQEVGKSLNLKVEYSLEVPWDAVPIALQEGKVDAHCAGMWATPLRGRAMAFTEPLFFSPTVIAARSDDPRFDNNRAAINDPTVTVALSDDDITTEIYRSEFPLAKHFDLPAGSPPEELLLALVTNKADVAFVSPGRLYTFAKGYPGKVKIVPEARPLRIYPDVVSVDIGQEELLHMLNTAIDQAIDAGAMDRIVAKYRDKSDVSYIVPVVRPYEWKQP